MLKNCRIQSNWNSLSTIAFFIIKRDESQKALPPSIEDTKTLYNGYHKNRKTYFLIELDNMAIAINVEIQLLLSK